MIGVDIVDLSDPLLKKRDQDALRLITNPHDDHVSGSNRFWHLWSAKEAVFKAKRELVRFHPKGIPIQLYRQPDKITFTSGDDIQGEIIEKDSMILAVASTRDASVGYQYAPRKTDNDSKEIRQLVSKYFLDRYGITTCVIHDGDRLPILDYRQTPVSLSHHASFLAFAYPMITES